MELNEVTVDLGKVREANLIKSADLSSQPDQFLSIWSYGKCMDIKKENLIKSADHLISTDQLT